MSHFTAWITLLVLIGSVWSRDLVSEEDSIKREPRFGFGLLGPIRKSFCENYCMSPDTSTYIVNLTCAVKCPELYLPHHSTSSTPSSTTPILSTTTPISSSTTQSSSTTSRESERPTSSTSTPRSSSTSASTSSTSSSTSAASTSPSSTPPSSASTP